MLQTEPDFMTFNQNKSMIFDDFKTYIKNSGGLLNFENLLNKTILVLHVEKDGLLRKFQIDQCTKCETEKFFDGDKNEVKQMVDAIYFRYGQLRDSGDNDMVNEGVGRKMRLWPEYKDFNQTEICTYECKLCYIEEGQFKNDILNGFGRKIYGTGKIEQGWFKDGKLHGYGVLIRASGKRKEGIFEEGEFMKEQS